jgi:predicted dithiol-disulfide oxidoreductase (DUF899 family)
MAEHVVGTEGLCLSRPRIGSKTFAELFDGRSQLLVYHFMFGYGTRVDEQNPGCTGRSFVADDFKYNFRAAFTEEQQRSGAHYNFRHTDDPGEQAPGLSAFALEDRVVHHTYSTYGRGVEQLMGTSAYLDLAPHGRQEEGLEPPAAWWHRHDEYETTEEQATR